MGGLDSIVHDVLFALLLKCVAGQKTERTRYLACGVAQACQDKMKRTLEQVNHQLGVNRNTRHQLERDMANKDHSINIDHTCHNLQNTSRAINLHGGIEKVLAQIFVSDWNKN
jgi:hypothetical protein